MARYIITVPEAEAAAFMTLMEERGYYYTPSADQDQEPEGDIPEWHKAILDERLAESRAGEGIPWEVVREELRARAKRKA